MINSYKVRYNISYMQGISKINLFLFFYCICQLLYIHLYHTKTNRYYGR